jgi:erythromycin esterase-like protein
MAYSLEEKITIVKKGVNRLAEGASIQMLTSELNIGFSTWFAWVKEPELKPYVDELKEKTINALHNDLRFCAFKAKSDPKYIRALEMALKRWDPEFIDRSEVRNGNLKEWVDLPDDTEQKNSEI